MMKKKKKGKTIKSVDCEIQLPEAMIQHIQSFMSGKEAARSSILSKSWLTAWLTRAVLDFDSRDFHISEYMFKEFVTKTMLRYQNLNLKIECFRLFSHGSYDWGQHWIASSHNLIVSAMRMGATTVELKDCSFPLPQEVLGSETLLKLSLICCEVEGSYVISCSRLKCLTLEHVDIRSGDDFFKDIISCCILMEELSLSNCRGLPLKTMNRFELHKLKHLFLHCLDVGSIFSDDFASRFPCLKDLSIHACDGCTNLQIASTSLEIINFRPFSYTTDRKSDRARFEVPNIRKFTYSCSGLPSHLSIDGPSKEWEFDISIEIGRFHKTSWFVNLKKLLKKFRLSRISLFINADFTHRCRSSGCEHEVDVEVVPKPLVVENLMIINAPPTIYSALVVRSLGAFRPKFINHCDCWMLDKGKSIVILRKKLIEQLFVPNWQDKFGHIGLKKVNVEILEEFDEEWRPLVLKKALDASEAEVRLQLIWED